MITFALKPHRVLSGENIVEILLDGEVIGGIYPDRRKPNGIKVVSVHMQEPTTDPEFSGEVVKDDGQLQWPPIPSVDIAFLASDWFIDETGRVVKPAEN